MTISSNHFSSYRFLFAPSKLVESIGDKVRATTEDFAPLRASVSNSSVSDKSISARIVSLLFSGRPSTIFRRVISVIINSVDRAASVWSIAHVLKEVVERFKPFFADFNASTPINRVFFIPSVAAPLPNSRPSVKFNGAAHAMNSTVGSVFMVSFFNTSARSGVPASKIAANYSGFVSAKTAALPSSFLCAYYLFNYCKIFKYLTDSIDNFCHNILRRYSSGEVCGNLTGNQTFGFDVLATDRSLT